VFASAVLGGVVLIAAGGVLWLGDSDGLAARMPTQLPPRRFARYPLVIGAVLVVIGAAGAAFP
jgi:hypothetical protein